VTFNSVDYPNDQRETHSWAYVLDAPLPDTDFVVSAPGGNLYEHNPNSGVMQKYYSPYEVTNKTVNGFTVSVVTDTDNPGEPQSVLVVKGV